MLTQPLITIDTGTLVLVLYWYCTDRAVTGYYIFYHGVPPFRVRASGCQRLQTSSWVRRWIWTSWAATRTRPVSAVNAWSIFNGSLLAYKSGSHKTAFGVWVQGTCPWWARLNLATACCLRWVPNRIGGQSSKTSHLSHLSISMRWNMNHSEIQSFRHWPLIHVIFYALSHSVVTVRCGPLSDQ